MAALGYAATGYGQGMLANREIGREQNRFNQQVGLQQQGIDLQSRELDERRRVEDRAFAERRVGRIEDILRDPVKRRNYREGELGKMERELHKLYDKFPDLDTRDAAPPQQPVQAPATVEQTTEQPQANVADLYQVSAPRPGVSDVLPQPNEEYGLPLNPRDLGGLQQGPSQFDPMGIKPSMSERPIPNTGQGVVGAQNPPVAGSFPANPFPAQAPGRAPVAPAPQQTQPQQRQGPVSIESLISQKLAEAATAAPAIRDQLLAEIAQIQQTIAQTGGTLAQTDLIRAQTNEVAPDSASNRARNAEAIAASEAERKVFRPRELDIASAGNELKRLANMAELASQKRLAAKDAQQLEMDLHKYGLSVAQFMAEIEDKKLQAAKTGLDIRKAMSEPDFWTKFAAETAQKYGYFAGPNSKQWYPGPLQNMLGGFLPGGGAPSGGPAGGQYFDVNAYRQNTKDPPHVQKQVIESMRKQGLIRP